VLLNKWSTRITVCVMGAALFAVSGCDYFAGPAQQIAAAEHSIAEGDYNTAAITLRNIVEKNPDNAAAQQAVARVELLRGELDGAGVALDAAAAAGASAPALEDLRAQLSLARGQYQELLAGTSERVRARALQGLVRIPEALVLYDQLLAQEPSSVDLNVYAAESHAIYGRWSIAQSHVDRAIQLKPDSARAWAIRASLLQRSGDLAAARAAYDKAILFAPGQLGTPEQTALLTWAIGDALVRNDISAATTNHARLTKLLPQAALTEMLGADVSLAKGDTSDAVGRLQRLVQAAPELQPARTALIAALVLADNIEQSLHEVGNLQASATDQARFVAAQAAIKAAAGGSDGVARSLALTQALLALDQSFVALRLLEAAIQTQPDALPLQVALVQTQIRSGIASEAMQRAQALRKRAPGNVETLTVLAQAQMASGDAAGAAVSYEALWNLAPSGPSAMALATVRQRIRQGDVFEPLLAWLAIRPHDVPVRMLLADAEQKRGRTARAMAEYEAVLADQPTTTLALNNLAWLYYQAKDPRALSTARRAYERLPESAQIADTFGWLLASSGDASGAVPILQAAVQRAPELPAIRYHLAAALAQGKDAAGRNRARMIVADLLRDPGPFEGRAEAERLLQTLSGG
jgi:tetratricopeptide (TPR) repeat protein